MEDNLYDSLSARYTKALARAMAYTKQVKAAAILNNGFNSAVTYGDGQALFSTAHPLVSGGVNSNIPSTPADLTKLLWKLPLFKSLSGLMNVVC